MEPASLFQTKQSTLKRFPSCAQGGSRNWVSYSFLNEGEIEREN